MGKLKMIKYEVIENIANPIMRRIAIILSLLVGIIIIFILLVAETIWETLKAMKKVIINQHTIMKPKLIDLKDYVKEIW